MLTLRNICGVILLVVGLAALVVFDSVREVFLFLSPDGQVSAFMWLILRILLISLGVVGGLILLFRRFLKIASASITG